MCAAAARAPQTRADKAIFLSAAFKCLRDLGKASMECSLIKADNNVHVDGNQRVSHGRHHVLQQHDDE